VNSNPLVSITIPSYKALHFEASLKSAVGQTYDNLEVIVFDNCPTQDIKVICNKYPQVKYIRNQEVGAANNVLKSVYENNGDYVKPLFDDDILHPFCVQRLVEKASAYNAPLVFSSSAVIDKNNHKKLLRRPFKNDCKINGHDMHKTMILNFSNFIGEFSTVIFSKKHLENIPRNSLFNYGGINFDKGLSDVISYINVVSKESVIYLDEELSYFRKDSSIESNSNPNTNPSFVYAITDWVLIMINSCELGVISKEEIRSKMTMVINFLEGWSKYHPSVEVEKSKFLEYMN
jgi:glycosyltransferase involved in cell wall biosynthesis